jgi:acetyl/propionyl-CoA carboxylase alpha subunit
VVGVDLVEAQLEIAAGGSLPWDQESIVPRGHAMEARIYAEDPRNGFLPQAGPVVRFEVDLAPGVRLDSGVETGDEVSVHFDPMLAKLVVHGRTREACRVRLCAALRRTVVHGFSSNVEFLLHVAESADFEGARVHTRWIDEGVPGWPPAGEVPPHHAAVAVAVHGHQKHRDTTRSTTDESVSQSPWDSLGPWRGPGAEGAP